jgi:hypothetical protein
MVKMFAATEMVVKNDQEKNGKKCSPLQAFFFTFSSCFVCQTPASLR